MLVSYLFCSVCERSSRAKSELITQEFSKFEENYGNSRESIADIFDEITSEHEPQNEPYQMTCPDLTIAPLQQQVSSADDPVKSTSQVSNDFQEVLVDEASLQSAAVVMDSVDAVTMEQLDVDDADNPFLTLNVVLPDVEADTETLVPVLAAGDQATLSRMPFNQRKPGLHPNVPDDLTVIGALNLFIPETKFELLTV